MGHNKNVKLMREQIRQVVKELLPELLKQEMFQDMVKQLQEQLAVRMDQISRTVNDGMERIDQRSKDVQSYVLRNMSQGK